MSTALLEISELRVHFGAAAAPALHGIGFDVQAGETLALVGESGSGKSVTALATLGLLPRQSSVSGSIRFAGQELLSMPIAQLRQVRGSQIGMVFQNPMTSLTPVLTIGRQLSESLCLHRGLSQQDALRQAQDMLERVGITQTAARMRQYPHELSGGMRQRVMIAMAMLLQPRLLIADEPTTALDVTIQAQVLDLMRQLAHEQGTALLLITHDMGVVAEMADRIVVLEKGHVVERNDATPLFRAPVHPYTQQLLLAVPSIDEPSPASTLGAPVLRLEAISKTFGTGGLLRRGEPTHALRGVSLDLHAGETIALVGESGSGKSTLGRVAARLLEADSGTVWLGERNASTQHGSALRRLRREMQMVFQDPLSSIDPRRKVADTVAEPLIVQGMAKHEALQHARHWLDQVGLPSDAAGRYPHEFSGGQCQRIAIARAMVCGPRLVIADEPTSALDVSTQAQILELLQRLQVEHSVAFLFITHDLAVARRVSHRVAVMRQGELVEVGPSADVIGAPQHAYTRALLSAVLVADPARRQRPRLSLPPARTGVPWHRVATGHMVRREEAA